MSKENNHTSPKEVKFGDLGFGTKITDASTRLLNRNGTFNVKRTGLPFLQSLNLYHTLIGMSWLKFLGLVVLFYVIINTFFALIYLLAGIENLNGYRGTNLPEHFWDAFFFSTQTFTTVGYGTISPVGFVTNIIASTETMLGWLAFALAAGLLYGRFSRPMAKILFSEHALIAPYQDKTSFQFRLANARSNQLIEVEVQVIFTIIETLLDGQKIRRFQQLELERKKVDFLALSWTVVHPINRNSPIFGWNKQKMDESDAEFLVLIKGFDDAFSQTVHTRASYRYNEIYWGGKYNSMYDNEIKGITTLYMDRLDSVQPVELGNGYIEK